MTRNPYDLSSHGGLPEACRRKKIGLESRLGVQNAYDLSANDGGLPGYYRRKRMGVEYWNNISAYEKRSLFGKKTYIKFKNSLG
jgi:hypothetical protein